MKKLVTKYGIIIGIGLLVNNYIRIFPSVQYKIDQSTSGWIATIFLISVLMFGINEYVKSTSRTNSYKFTSGLLVGVLMTIIGTTIFSIISTTILIQNNVKLDIIETILSRIIRLGFVGSIASAIILLTYKTKED